MSTTNAGNNLVQPQPQCQFFVVRKKRLCRMTVRPGRDYCGEHEPQPPPHQPEADKRIPCPNDPKHTCYVSKLEKHLAKCNARKTENPPYIECNLNAGDIDTSPRIPLKFVSSDTIKRIIDKVNKLYDEYIKDTISAWQAPSCHHPAVQESISQADRADSSRRHLRQASRLMQLAEEQGLVSEDTCYVELGAGKGMLSYYMGVSWCARDSRVVCVDRASLRHKRDNLLRDARSQRLRADLRDLALHRAPLADRAKAVVGVAKHLCGVATDFALRCMCAEDLIHKTRGILVATCCHHRCERGSYVGTSKLQDLGISGEELNVMFSIVSWATCGDGHSRERRLQENEHQSNKNIKDSSHTKNSDTAMGSNDEDIQGKVTWNTEVETKKPKLSEEIIDSHNDEKSEEISSLTSMTKHNSDGISSNKEQDVNVDKSNTEVDSEKSQDTFKPLDVKSRETIGRRAKLLIDYGRILYLKDKGFEASLCYYVPTSESLENLTGCEKFAVIMSKSESPNCRVCGTVEKLIGEHLLAECARLQSERRAFEETRAI